MIARSFRRLPRRAGVASVGPMGSVLVMLRSKPDEWAALLAEALPGHAVRVRPDGHAVDYAVVGKPPPGELGALHGLRAVFSVNAGVEALLESNEVPPGVPLVRMVDHGLVAGMTEWVVAQTLAWHRNLFAYRDSQTRGQWAPQPEALASERAVAVLGLGTLGRPVAETLARLGFVVRGWSRSPHEITGVRCLAGADGLHAAVAHADTLVNLLPLTPATENILDAPLLRGLAPGAVVINAARGRHLVDADLLALLDSGHLRAAVLDVFREEPLPPPHPFWSHPRVFLSPHVAAPTHARVAASVIADNIRGFEAGRPLSHVVDRDRGY